MREIQASEAKTHLPKLLDATEQEETLVITRHGQGIARLIPEADQRSAEVAKVIAEMKDHCRTAPPITVEEILSARDEGRA
jgi:prevent-host-death family protein